MLLSCEPVAATGSHALRHEAKVYRHLAKIRMSGSSPADWHLVRVAAELETRAAMLEEVEARSEEHARS
jgi:hypothetical protein